MSPYVVHLVQPVEISVHVDADSPEAAIEAAHEQGVSGICAHCSGWGQEWSRDDDVALEEVAVFDQRGEQVWSRDEQEGSQR